MKTKRITESYKGITTDINTMTKLKKDLINAILQYHFKNGNIKSIKLIKTYYENQKEFSDFKVIYNRTKDNKLIETYYKIPTKWGIIEI